MFMKSKKPYKQRKYLENKPVHKRKENVRAILAKDLRKELKKRNVVVRKGDVVEIMKGDFKGKSGKVLEVLRNKGKLLIEKIAVKKADGREKLFPIRANNTKVIELGKGR
jgi:large subunit ribosomal protein L24